MFNIKEVRHTFKAGIGVHLNVSNLEQTVAFYTDKLGFEILFYEVNNGQAMLSTNNQECILGLAQAQSIVPSTTCITFEVVNINHAVQVLEQKGIAFSGSIMEVPNGVKLAAFNDPDGYHLMLYEQPNITA